MGSSIIDGKLIHRNMTVNARGGTELLAQRLVDNVSQDFLQGTEIHLSRVDEVDKSKKQILWCHDLAQDPAVQHLANGGWEKYDTIVFVSHWQQYTYNVILGVPYDIGVVLENAIVPFPNEVAYSENKPTDKIRLIYFSTPHRGLNILLPAFDHVSNIFKDQVELNVYSSFDLYGWEERDEPFSDLFKKLQDHPNVNYSKSVDNDTIRKELERSHILAYPSIWQETSCLCLIEAMAAGLSCVHSSLGALPETSRGLTYMYGYNENLNSHANIFASMLANIIDAHIEGKIDHRLTANITNNIHDVKRWKSKWENVLK